MANEVRTDVDRPRQSADAAAFFGHEVRCAREKAGMTQQQLAEVTHYQRPYVTRVENGSLLASHNFAEACDQHFHTSGYLSRLRRQMSEWAHPGWFIPYLNLEREASGICDYSNALIMGILQTSEYADAVFRAAHPRENDSQIQGRVEARLNRREVMASQRPPLLWVILHETVLHTAIGGAAVMRKQLQHLLDAGATADIVIQVLPFTAGAPAVNLPFNLLTQDDGPTVVYAETLGEGYVNDSRAVVAEAESNYDRLRASARSQEESRTLIHQAMKGFTT